MDGKNSSANYNIVQVFGDKNGRVAEEDIISAVEFDQTGRYLSLGDRAGRLIIFDLQQCKNKKNIEYSYYTEVFLLIKTVPIAHPVVRPAKECRYRGAHTSHQLACPSGQESVCSDSQ
jgi:hypothetical protein